MIYYIFDTHFNYQKIFDKCKRPFEFLDEMKEVIVCICHYLLMDLMEFNSDRHIHNKIEKNRYAYKLIKDYYKDLKASNAGVDVIDFEPRN